MLLYHNFIRTLQKILLWIILILIAIQVTGYIALQFPATQTFLIKKIVDSASKQINGKIDIKKVYFIFFNKIILQDISIVSTDRTPLLDSLKAHFNQSDTLVSCEKLSVSIYPSDLLRFKIRLKAVNLEDGVFNLQNEGGRGNTNLSRIFKIDKDRQIDTTKKRGSIHLLANSLNIKNFRFTLSNPDKYTNKGDSIINFANLAVSDINVNINNINIERDTLFGTIRNISGLDKSGFRLAELSGLIEVSSTETRIKNLQLADSYSKINARYFYMQYDTPKDLVEFTDSVKLGADFNETFFSFKTIGRITPSMRNSTLALFLSGEVSGPIANLRSKSLQFTSESGQTYVDLAVKMNGLPDIRETMSIVKINNCYTTSNDISQIIASINGTSKSSFFDNMAPFIRYDFKGGVTGLPDDIVVHGVLSSSIGKVMLDVLLKNEKEKNGFLIDGHIRTDRFNVGKLLSNKLLGELTMETSIYALLRKGGGVDLSIDSIRINKLGLNGYDYSNIYARGEYRNKDFDGRIICHDPNLDFIFQGLVSLNKRKTSKYNFYADIPYANLAALNFDKRDSISTVKIRTVADFTKTEKGDIIGNINVMNASYANSKGDFNIGAIKFTSHQADSSYSGTLTAPFINATYDATAPFTSFIKKMIGLTLYEHAGNYLSGKQDKELFNKKNLKEELKKRDEYHFSVTTFNTNSMSELIFPGSYIQDSTHIEADITKDNQMKLNLYSGRLAMRQNYLKGVNLEINNRDSLLDIRLLSDNIRMARIKLDSALFNIKGGNNLLKAVFGFKNDSTESNYARLETDIRFSKDSISMHFDKASFISLEGAKWHFQPSTLMLSNSTLWVNRFALINNNQYFTANGHLSKQNNSSLSLGLNNFDIRIFNLFLNRPFNVEGYFSGKANLSSTTDNPNMLLDITGDSVYIYNNQVGTMKIMSKWYQPDKRFNLLISTKRKGKSNLMITGYYKPDNNYLELGASLDNLSLAYFEPFLSSVISKTNGTFSGNLKLRGPVDQLKLEGDNCRFDDFKFTVNYTQVPYTLNGPVTLNENGIFAEKLNITDQFGGKGQVTGGLHYRYFKDLKLDTRISFKNFQCLNTQESNNETFYGNAFASGFINISGPFSNLLLDINIIPDRKTALHIPLSATAIANQTNLLTFTAPKSSAWIDPYDTLMINKKKQKVASQLQVQLRANMNPDAEMFIEINKSLGDVIKANGDGVINMNINPSKEVFDIFGDYNINQGDYRFVLAGFGLAAKDFIIQPGGTISFNGNIENTMVNLTAIYKTKAAINTLIADTSSISTRRTVDCKIGMSGNLMNPQLTFNIDIPDLDPTTKVRVESALNTEGKIQKQFAALLISGGFLPDEQSGITNNSTILYSNVSEILSNQINNIFHQLGIPLDLGFNYQPGEKGTNIFDVAISTQLFNNRLIINGNIGNDPYANTNNNSVIGNVNVELKLDKSGKLRLTLFSHAADQYSNYLDDRQRSGIGVSYQQEFNSVRDIFRKKSKAQKEFERKEKAAQKAQRKAAREARREYTATENLSSTESPQ